METYDDTEQFARPVDADDLPPDLPDDLTVGLSDDPFADDLDEQIAAREPQHWVTRSTVALAGLFLLVGGFLAGAQVQKHFGAVPAAASTGGTGGGGLTAGTFGGGGRGNGGGGRGSGGNGGGGQSSANARTGTVKLIDGTTIYVQMSDGQIVTVRTSSSTAVQTVQPGALADLTPGTPVSVEGPAGSDDATGQQ